MICLTTSTTFTHLGSRVTRNIIRCRNESQLTLRDVGHVNIVDDANHNLLHVTFILIYIKHISYQEAIPLCCGDFIVYFYGICKHHYTSIVVGYGWYPDLVGVLSLLSELMPTNVGSSLCIRLILIVHSEGSQREGIS